MNLQKSRSRHVCWSRLPLALRLAFALLVPLAGAAPMTTALAAPGAWVPAPLTVAQEARSFSETGYRIDHDPFWTYFQSMGGVDTFGYPVSRTFSFPGCTTQFFQRQLLQQCGANAPVQTMNLLDPELMPYHQINGSIFPLHNAEIAAGAPAPGTPNYGQAVLEYIRSVAPNEFEGLPVSFFRTFVTTVPGVDPQASPDLAALVNLELWGFPTSAPQFDPNNADFVYQRFQRGIMHFDASTGVTRGILLADYFKGILVGQEGQNLPPDLARQAVGSRFFGQYCPTQPKWVCRPSDLPDTDLTQAFEPLVAWPATSIVPPEAQRVVEAALQDAATRLGTPREQVKILRLEERQWRDTSLGCPQPGMMYAQVITPGYLVVVSDTAQSLDYHTDTRGRVVRC